MNYESLRVIVFNGRKAQALFEHTVLRQQGLEGIKLPRLLMPSTGPAATLPISAKIERWRQDISINESLGCFHTTHSE